MRLIHGQDALVGEWVAARIPHVGDVDAFGAFATVGVATDDGLIAGIVYHNYISRYGHCEISFAADTPRFATREVIRGLLSVPFEQYGCRTVSLLIPHKSARVTRFVGGIGFVRRGCLPEFFAPGQHGEVYTMTIKDYEKLRARIG